MNSRERFDFYKVINAITETMKKCGQPLSDTQQPILTGCLAVWLDNAVKHGEKSRDLTIPHLSNRGDGVDGHYCISRKHAGGYYEFWNDDSKKWGSAGTVFNLGKAAIEAGGRVK